VFNYWASIEADFVREYRIYLVDIISKITWRQFIVLLNGLSPTSLWVNILVKKYKPDEKVIKDSKEADRVVNRIL
jgi:hypothetical protein